MPIVSYRSEIRFVIGFMNARAIKLTEIHSQICNIYGYVMYDSMVMEIYTTF